MLEVIAVEQVVGVERDEAAIGVDDVDAGFFDGADVEGVSIEKMDDEHTENIFVAEIGGSGNAREATEKFAEAGGAGFRRMVGGEKLEQAIADAGLFFVDDGVAGGVNKDVGLDKTSKRNDFPIKFQGVGHCEAVRVARDRDDVFGAKNAGLLENLSANFGKGETVGGRIEIFDTAGVLDGLQGDTANAGLGESEVDDFADFTVVETFAQSDDEGGREVVLVQAFQRFFTDAAKIAAAEIEKGLAFEGIKLQIDFEVCGGVGNFADEIFVLGDSDAVGVEHQVANGASPGDAQDLKEIRVESGLTTGDLDHVGAAFVANNRVEHFFDQGKRAMFEALGTAGGIADGAADIARIGYFDE